MKQIPKTQSVGGGPATTTFEAATSGAKLLLVDDEPRNLRLLEALLLPHGYELLMANSGEECLEVVAEHDVDLVLLDIMMPGMDGYEVTRRLRSNPSTRLLPIVVISALRETTDRVDGIEAGCDDFISKPFDKDEVLAKILTTLRLSYYRRQLDEKEKFLALITKISEGIVVCDPDWTIRRTNEHGGEYLDGVLPGANLLDTMFDTYTVSLPRFRLAESLSGSRERFLLARSRAQNSKTLYLHANLDILKDPDGNVSTLVLTMRDMTSERREEKLKEDFLNVVSQKLRGPLSTISDGLSDLQEGTIGTLNEDQLKSVKAMAEEARALSGLVEKLNRFSLVNSASVINSQMLTLGPRDEIVLKDYLPKLLQSAVRDSGNNNVKLDVKMKDPKAAIRISNVYFDAIISNLIENAIVFCDKKTVKVGVIVARVDQNIIISIRDNGPGIPVEEKKKIFETFYQIGRDSATSAAGAGLGLPLVRRLVTAYGGDVRLESDPGRGANFTITLPAA